MRNCSFRDLAAALQDFNAAAEKRRRRTRSGAAGAAAVGAAADVAVAPLPDMLNALRLMLTDPAERAGELSGQEEVSERIEYEPKEMFTVKLG